MENKKYLSQEDIKAKVEYLSSHRFNHTLHKYIDIAGDLIAGTLLSQIMYWFSDEDGKSKVSIWRDGYCWLAKRREDWMDEIRISKKQYDCAIKKLTAEIEPAKEEKEKNPGNKGKRREKKFDREKALVEVKTFHFNGVPVTHIRPITENINRMVEEWKNALAEKIASENDKVYSPNPPNGNLVNSPNGNLVNSPKVNMEIHERGNSYNNIYNNIITDTEDTNRDYIYRDYIPEGTDKYALPDKSERGERDIYAPFSEEKGVQTQKQNRYISADYDMEQLREHITPVIREDIYTSFCRPERKEGLTNTLIDIICEFYKEYYQRFGKRHRVLSDKAYEKIVENYLLPPDVMDGLYDFDTYQVLMEEYFNTNYNENIELSISHFMCREIRKHLFFKSQ